MKKLTVGMRTDELPIDQVQGSWRDAINKSVYQKFGSVSDEDGADNVTPSGAGSSEPYPTNKKCIGVITLNEDSIHFFGTTDVNDSEMGRIKNDGLYYPILRDSILDLNENYPVQGAFERKFNNNIIIGWGSRNTNPKILNIDCIPFGIDGSYAVETADIEKAKTLLALFSPFTTPIINPYFLEVKDGQGGFVTGTIYPFINYQGLDGTFTPYSKIYNGIPIIVNNITNMENTIGGNSGGINSGKAIQIKFDNIDTNYKNIQVGYLHVIDGQTFARLEDIYKINGNSLTIILKGIKKIAISLDEVLVANAIYDKVGTMTTVQKKLYLGDVEQISNNYNYQNYANLIGVKWIREKRVKVNNVTAKSIIDGSGNITTQGTYQDPTKVFFDKHFKHGECYALYIKLNWKNGAPPKVFHIPGRASSNVTIDDKEVLNLPDIDSNNNFFRYQLFNTHRFTSATRGAMGFWENENEEYPVDPANPTTAVHPDFANISGISYAHRKVRHHVFPDISGISSTKNFVYGDYATSASYPTYLETEILGLEISNVNIPAEIVDLVDSWEIMFAQRDNSSIRVIGNDIYLNKRFHTFDLMKFKPGIFPNYIKPLGTFRCDTVDTFGDTFNFVEYLKECLIFSDPSAIYAGAYVLGINSFLYLGENTTIPVVNTGISDCIYVNDGASSPFDDPTTLDAALNVTSGSDRTYMFADLGIFRRNVYVNFQNQKLISTGMVVKISGSGVQSTKDIYGGDVYINRHSFVDSTTPGDPIISVVVESAANIGLRNEDLTQSKYFYPKYSNPTPSWYGYNADYNAVNTFNQYDIWFPSETCTDNDVTIFPQKIPFSLVEATETSSINWRIFKINSYYEMTKDKGKIVNLLGSNKTLYIQMEYTLFLAEIKDSIQSNGVDIVSLGVTDIFDRPPTEIFSINEGYIGCKSQYACGLTKLGYHVIDRQQGRVFLLPIGSYTPDEISNKGQYNFFKKYSQNLQVNIDNPFIGMGYTAGYNQKTNSLVICKQDFTYATVDEELVITEGYSFTISYNPELNQGNGGWASFHSYKPNYIYHNRMGFFGIENLLFKLFKHNSTSLKCKYYDEIIKDSYIDVVVNDVPEQSKRFDNVSWISTTEKSGVVYKNKTASHLLVYNDTQCSEKIVLINNTSLWYSNDVRNVEDTWNFNNFRDMVKNVSSAFLDSKNQLVISNINTSKAWFDKSKFISKFVIFRIINNNADQDNFHISFVGSNIKKSDR